MSLPETFKVTLRSLGAVYILNAVLRDPQCKEKFRSLNRRCVQISFPIWLSTPLGLQLPTEGRRRELIVGANFGRSKAGAYSRSKLRMLRRVALLVSGV